MIINDFAKETLALHCFGSVTGFDGDNNEFTRVFGYYFDEPSAVMTVMIYKEDSAKLLACFSKSTKIAFVASDPMTFKTIQMKGEYLSHAVSTQVEENMINEVFQNKRKDVFNMFGLPDSIHNNWKYLPAISIKLKCNEIYDQTPRVNTGNKIS